MSNPAVCYLIKTQVGGVYFAIEDNLGEAIHFHYGNVRIDMTVREFLQFSDCVINAARELFALRKLTWDCFDKEAFKDEWMTRYKYVSKVEMVEIPLRKLFMKESFKGKRSIKRIIPLVESEYIQFLRRDSDDSEYYLEKGIYEPSRAEKIERIRCNIQNEGYPYDDSRILIDQEGYILDGVKRASCLCYLYGADYTIPAIQINIEWEKSLDDRRVQAEEKIKEFLDKQKGERKEPDEHEESAKDELSDYDVLISIINNLDIDYVVVDGQLNTRSHCDWYILLKNGGVEIVKKQLEENNIIGKPFSGYTFAYAMNTPMIYKTTKGVIILHDRYMVNSVFVNNVIMPLDRNIVAWIWRNREHKNGIWSLNECAHVILKVIFHVLRGEDFSPELICNIEKYRSVWDEDIVKRVINNIFFSYGEVLICLIQGKKYTEAVLGYTRYAEY